MDDMTGADATDAQNGGESDASGLVRVPEPISPTVPTPGFSDLVAPAPVEAAPPVAARTLAFAAILVGGLLGGLVGYGIGDVLYPDSVGAAAGGFVGALTGAVGLGVLANLTLRAMNEWKTAAHPESERPGSARTRAGRNPESR